MNRAHRPARATRPSTRLLSIAAIALLGAGALAGCAPKADPAPSSKPSATAKPSTPSETPVETTAPSDTTKWGRFSDATVPVSFDLPDGWKATSESDGNGSFQVIVSDGAGKEQLRYIKNVQGIGGACTDGMAKLKITDLDETTITPPGYVAPAASEVRDGVVLPMHFVYRVAEAEGKVRATVALTNVSKPIDACMMYNFYNTGGKISLFTNAMQVDTTDYQGMPFTSMDEAKGFQQTAEYQTLKRILTSISFKA